MKMMDIDSIKNNLDCKLLQTIYNKIYVIDLTQRCCGEWVAVDCVISNLQSYDNWVISLAEKMYKSDATAFFVQTNLNRICEAITETSPSHTIYYRLEENSCIQEFRLSICYADEYCKHLVFFQEELFSNYPKPLETINNLSHSNSRFEYLVKHVVEDFIEININTGKCHIFPADRGMQTCDIYEKQLAWWAEHTIVPEERENYLREYELGNLIQSLRANNGYHQATYTTFSGSTRNSMLINSRLIKENYGAAQTYIYIYAQDITQLKAQETRNKQLVNISQQLLALSQTEPLTGLYNRAACEKLVEEHLAATMSGVSGTMLLIDIDHFKEFNDKFGHPTGDFVLKFLGKTMQDIFRSDDIVSRWGGDEFVVFMRNVYDQKMIISRIERLRARLCQCTKDGSALPITISIGGTIAAAGNTINKTFDNCDKLLYQVKSQGRNGFLIGSE